MLLFLYSSSFVFHALTLCLLDNLSLKPVEEEAEMRRSASAARTMSSPREEGPPNRIMDDQEEEDDRAENTSSIGIGLGKGGEAIPERGSHHRGHVDEGW